MGQCPVIFVPTHRSYADFIIFSYVCFTYDIEIPAIAAGMDFQGMLGMGEILRNTGAFYLRRAYSDDPLYWTTFKQYVYQLVTKGDLPIEFFIEGTRSRSNKSLIPKYGFINMILKAFFFSEVPDILFVPVSISYDRILEESLFAFELLGIPKPKETTKGFFKSLKILKEHFGNVYIHIDDPISAKAFLGDKVDRSVHSLSPLYQQEMTDEEKSLISPFGYEIVRRQQNANVITTFNLVATVLNVNLSLGNEFMSIDMLLAEVEYLSLILTNLGAYIFEQNFRQGLQQSLVVHQNLIRIQSNGAIGLVENSIVLDAANLSKLKGHTFSQEVMNYSVPFVMLQMYTNPVLHHLKDVAFIGVVLKSVPNLDKDELFQHFKFLKSLFANEFVSFNDWLEKDYDAALEHALTENLIVTKNASYALAGTAKLNNIFRNSIEPFFMSYFVVLDVLLKSSNFCEEKNILVNAQQWLEYVIDQRDVFIHPYCLSLETLGNCLNSLCNMGVLKKRIRNKAALFEIDQHKVEIVKGRLEMYIPEVSVILNFNKHGKNKL
ncbi:dihydroxyacetone phosphate acyltransferase isoform X2 [Cylas formicarius]|nr:dihydroxyacetone phosphate acyltransferase isoform X2 [Cylas formicarius]